MQPWHLTISSSGRFPLFPTEASRRQALSAMGRTIGHQLALYHLGDEHFHAALVGERPEIRRSRQALTQALTHLSDTPLEPSYCKQVRDRRHMLWLVEYLLTQPSHHGHPVDPALWTGSCFPDLVGARRIPGVRLQLNAVLPRFQLRSAYQHVGLSPVEIVPADRRLVWAAGAPRLIHAAAASLCVDPDLRGNGARVVEARVAAAHLARESRILTMDMAYLMGLTDGGARRLATRWIDRRTLDAVRRYIALESAVWEVRGSIPRVRFWQGPNGNRRHQEIWPRPHPGGV